MKVHEAKKGFEVEFDLLVKKKDDLSVEKEKAYEEAKAKIDADFADREATIFQLLSLITDEVEVEEKVEEAVEAQAEETAQAEVEQPPQVEAQTEAQPTQAPGQAFSPFSRI